MKRRLFNLAAAVSLVLCVATAVLWVQSYERPGAFVWLRRSGDEQIAFEHGNAFLKHGTGGWSGSTPLGLHYFSAPLMKLRPFPYPRWIRWDGFGHGFAYVRDGAHADYFWLFPLWHFFLATFLLPAAGTGRFFHHRNMRRLRRGCCQTCGYDLRASPERCPECGTQVARPKPQQPEGAAA